jgi:hypothetical protein
MTLSQEQRSLPPNQRLHLTPRRGHRGRDRVCYTFWLLAIRQSFRGAGEPRPLGWRQRGRHEISRTMLHSLPCFAGPLLQ